MQYTRKMKTGNDRFAAAAASTTIMSLVGIICIILGALVVTFDYPQIEYLGGFDNTLFSSNDNSEQKHALYDRLVVEFSIGVIILIAGVILCVPKMISMMIKLFGQKRQGIR